MSLEVDVTILGVLHALASLGASGVILVAMIEWTRGWGLRGPRQLSFLVLRLSLTALALVMFAQAFMPLPALAVDLPILACFVSSLFVVRTLRRPRARKG